MVKKKRETLPVPAKDLKHSDHVVFPDGTVRKVVSVHMRIAFEDGHQIRARLNDTIEVAVPEPVELCPNGQPYGSECREIDPCEACWQDQQEEGDEIERSMGLRD